tara:strand:- start:317 stop:592 length:276 start_codon:yes stop_codon:yes gene_type:complete
VKSLGELFDDYAQKPELDGKLKETRIRQAWASIAGEYIAKYTTYLRLRDDSLLVEINDSTLRHELFLHKEEVMNKVNVFLGEQLVNQIQIR